MKMVQANRMVLPRSRLSRVPSGSNNGDFLPPDDSFTAGKKGFKFSYDKQKIYTYNISRYDYCTRLGVISHNFFCSYYRSLIVCHMLRFGVAAIFGPQSEASSDHVQSMCQAMKIPYIQTRWGPKRSPNTNNRIGINPATSAWPNTKATVNNPLSINLHPNPASLSRVRIMSQVTTICAYKTLSVMFNAA